ncbi:MAG: hypothetical protein FWE05_08235 [Defluviitaleaceae bacterium]|nr:hypothetical protein [Defluviitaleaceae bacterium]
MKMMILLIMAVAFLAGCGYVAAESTLPSEEQAHILPETTPTVYEDISHNAVAVSAASSHALALMEDGALWAWGTASESWDSAYNHSLIGDGTAETRHLPVQIMKDVVFAVAGHYHSFAITADGVLWSWGNNWWGQIGDGTTENRLSPVSIMNDVVYAAMPSIVPNSHASEGVRSYTIRSDGTLWAWGANGQGDAFFVALGDGTEFEDRHSPVQILENVKTVYPTARGGFAITHDNTLWMWQGRTFVHNDDDEWIGIADMLSPVPIMENVVSISSGGAITTTGELWQIHEDGTLTWVMDDVVYATSLGGANFAITTNGTLWGWGQNRLPGHWSPRVALGDGTTIDRDTPVQIMENVVSVMAIGNNAYAITTKGELWGWGTGQLSGLYAFDEYMWEYAMDENGFPNGKRWLLADDGGTDIRLSPVKMMEHVVSVSATYHLFDHGWMYGFRTFALTEDGNVWAWGANDRFNQGANFLGDGTSEYQPYPVQLDFNTP